MRPYEVMVILDASLEDDAARALVDRFTQQLTAAGAKSVSVDNWGKRRLAYPVTSPKSRATTWSSKPTLSQPRYPSLTAGSTLADEVIRHKVIRLPERAAGRSRRSASPASSESTAAVGANTNGA